MRNFSVVHAYMMVSYVALPSPLVALYSSQSQQCCHVKARPISVLASVSGRHMSSGVHSKVDGVASSVSQYSMNEMPIFSLTDVSGELFWKYKSARSEYTVRGSAAARGSF